MNIAGHTLTDRQAVALFGLYRGVLKDTKVYGVNVARQLDSLADRGIIARTGMGAYMIPYSSPGADIVSAAPDFVISQHLG
jgi:hypothetical protein